MKRTLSTLLSIALALTLLCGVASHAQSVPFDQTLTFSYLTKMWEPFKTDVNLIPAIEEATNSKIEIEYAPVDNYETRINTMLASSNLSDAIMVSDVNQVSNLIDQGAIIPLDDLINEYAPNLLAQCKPEDMPYLYNIGDNHTYVLPSINVIPILRTWTVRKDWLDNLGIEIPEKWDEWVEVWKAMRDNDANGNGDLTDEIPITGELYPFLYPFGIYVSGDSQKEAHFCVLDDGTYTLVYEHPNYREYLTQMNYLYTERLLDPEFATRQETEKRKVMNSNIGGFAYTHAEQVQLSTDALRDSGIENAVWVGVVPPKGPFGDQAIIQRPKFYNYTVITVGAEQSGKAADIVKFWNWMYGPDGVRMTNYGVEEVHYDMIDGVPVINSEFNKNFNVYRNAGMNFQPMSHIWLQDAYVQVLTSGQRYEELSETRKLFYDALFINEPYFVTAPPTLSTEAYIEHSTDLLSQISQLQANAVVGNITIDDFFKEYELLKEEGLQDIIDQGQEAYTAIMGA